MQGEGGGHRKRNSDSASTRIMGGVLAPAAGPWHRREWPRMPQTIVFLRTRDPEGELRQLSLVLDPGAFCDVAGGPRQVGGVALHRREASRPVVWRVLRALATPPRMARAHWRALI